MKRFILGLVIAGLATTFHGCKEDPLQAYNGGDAVCFWQHSYNHSLYGASADELPKDILKMRINIMGYTKPYDRAVTGAVIEDPTDTPVDKKLTTATPNEYRIIGGTIPANSIEGWFEVEVPNLEKLENGELKLNLTLTENEHFGLGLKENQTIALKWSRQLLQPQTWNAMRFFFCSIYSTQVYKIYIQVTGLTEFWYYNAGPDPVNNPNDVQVTQEMGYVWGRRFGDIVRAYEVEHGTPMLHDDGTNAGSPIVPIH